MPNVAKGLEPRQKASMDLPHNGATPQHRGKPQSGLPGLAQEGKILDQFSSALVRRGVVGEAEAGKVLYLAVTSRFLNRPVSVALKGPSSGGKSFLAQQVLDFFPADAYYALSAMSERALAYSKEPLAHRFLVVYEAAGLQGDFGSYLIRSLLSEGRLRYETVEKTKRGMQSKFIEREGPTGLIVTTSALRLHPENETRLLSIPVTDSAEHTRRVLIAIASEDRDEVDLSPWHDLQGWLTHAEHRVKIPYAEQIAAIVPPVAVRLRRDFGAVLNLIRSHALLHQTHRTKDQQGRVLADFEDYAAVRELVEDLMADGVEATVSSTMRETVGAVDHLTRDSVRGPSCAAVAAKLGLDKSTVSRRLRTAQHRGYLMNAQDQRGRPAEWMPGEQLPEDRAILPSREEVEDRCSVASRTGGIENPRSPVIDHPPASDPRAHIQRRRAEGIDRFTIARELASLFPPPQGSGSWTAQAVYQQEFA